ncbi:N-acetylmuramoyl-L-alanine amidase [Flavobacterium sp. HSC-61S13]|uniref:N-acetylmuramoyl-L-alanine amidase n=1 Tax=Flavobacterium sp. HSC-61S13 TaxID=2910963 RepID=UPI00209F4C92|nr:N-acetylmuramoyl-L-alanine amidase [Flavobacterium sp. HSC-61S13]MCP1996662.1 N-acetylmuramoyl-L-alanine amidase [Flavobacterium sp. HSC-61S13]
MAQEMSFPSAGHHLSDPGAVANGYTEFDIMNRFRNKLILYLSKKGHKYITDENSETNTQYQSRIKPIKGDVIIDMHLNAGGPTATGCEVFISNTAGMESKTLAKELVDQLSKSMGITNRGVKTESQSARGKIGVLNKAGTAVLIEFCFITNMTDLKAFFSNEDCLVEIVGNLLIKYDKNK